ncbi:LOW QUALITY PROTEIN: uncharacterized protein C20orf141 homolog [Erethizon dorsatum]
MTWLCLPRPKALADPILLRGAGAVEGSGGSVHPVSPGDSSWAQLLDSVLDGGALGLTTGAVFTMAGPALLLLLLLVSFLTFDLLHRPAGPTLPQHRLLTTGQSQGAGEGPGQQAAPLLPTGQPSLRDTLLLLLLGLGLLLGAHSLPLALLGLAFCLHPWA